MLKGHRTIGGVNYLGLIEFAKTLPPISFAVEVGSDIGESAAIFITYANIGKICCVDRWDVAEREAEFDKFSALNPKVIKMKLESAIASTKFSDGQLDFVYIDASHDYEGVKQDIELWTPKVRAGGQIGGHDYTWEFNGVIQAVFERFSKPSHVFRDGSWLVELHADTDKP